MAWYDNAVFYHIYPLGLCGCAHENDGQPVPGAFKKLDAWAQHAAKLGCTAIYIGPLFESGSHGYDTIDYRRVDRRLGTNEEFKEFVAACHERGQKVIVDGVFNHVGRDFFAFRELKEHRENARYKDWFCDVNFWGNNEYNDGFSYGNWGGFNLLVKLNQRNPEVQNYHFDTIRFWVDEFDIDGIRLDAADVLDFDFMKGLRRLANEVKPEFWLMGEVIHGDYSRWANPEMLHSVTNYELHKGLWSGHNDHNYFEIAHTMRRLQGLCHDTKLYLFSDNHDVERLPNKLRNREHIRHIALLVYTLWGIPSIYYGSEFGIEGKKEWGSDWPLRPCLELSDFKDAETTNPVTSVYAALGRLKAELPELTDEAKHSVTVLRKAKEYLEEKPELAEELSAAERRKRAQLQSKPVYRYVALAIFIMGIVSAAYGLYAVTTHTGGYGIYFALFGFAAIFLFSSYNMLPTAHNNHSAIMKRAEKAEAAMAEYVKHYPSGAFPVPSRYAHPIVLKQMSDAIEEGRAVTVPEALAAVESRLKSLNADVQVEQEEYDEVVVIKAMFLNHDYQ